MIEGVARLIAELDGLTYAESGEGNVFLDQMPATPDDAVAVYTAIGPEADSKLPYDPVDFQVIVRCQADHSDWARDTERAIYSKLHGKRNFTLPDGTYAVFILAQNASPFPLGPDENARLRYVIDYRSEVLNPTDERQAL